MTPAGNIIDPVTPAGNIIDPARRGISLNIQFAYRKNHSCDDLLALVANDWSQSLDQNEYVAAAFLDMSKAFDTVNHSLLLQELFEIGVGGVAMRWFASYLTDRQQSRTWRIMLEKVADSARKAVKLAEPYKPYGGQFLEFCSISLSTYQTCMKLTRKSTEFCQFFCRHYPSRPTAESCHQV